MLGKENAEGWDCVRPGEDEKFVFSVIPEVTAVHALNLVTDQKQCQKHDIA